MCIIQRYIFQIPTGNDEGCLLILILPVHIEATQQVGLAPALGMELPVQDRPDTPGFVQRSPCLFQLGSEIIIGNLTGW